MNKVVWVILDHETAKVVEVGFTTEEAATEFMELMQDEASGPFDPEVIGPISVVETVAEGLLRSK